MKYLFLHSGREWSGTARAFATAARGLALRGHSVTFVAEPDSTVERVVSETAMASERPLLHVEALDIGGSLIGAASRLASLARRQRADVVFVHNDREHLVAAVAYRLGSRARVVRRISAGLASPVGKTGRNAGRIAPACYMFASDADAQRAHVAGRVLGKVIAKMGVPETLPQNASDLAGEDVNVVCVHDASSRSRAAAAIRTVSMLAPRHPGLHLLIIGEGAYDDDLRMQAAALGALQLVTFLGDRADQINVMRSARLGWVVADSDNAVYGILDFMSLGIPVLAPQKSVAQDYVLHDITGMLVSGDDANLTAAVAAELLTSDARREAMGAAARGRVVRENLESVMIDGFELAAAASTSRVHR